MAQEFKLNYTGLEINNKLQKINCSDTVNNTFANALKGSVSGEAIALTDISPVEHDLNYSVRSKNLWNPEKHNLRILNERFVSDYIKVKKNTNYIFTVDNREDIKWSIKGFTDEQIQNNSMLYVWENGEILSQQRNVFNSGNYEYIAGRTWYANAEYNISSDSLFQLEEGTTATAYTPYIADIESVNVLIHGKNLLNGANLSWESSNGIFRADNKGNIKYTGTPYYLYKRPKLPFVNGGNYTFSACINSFVDSENSDGEISIIIRYKDNTYAENTTIIPHNLSGVYSVSARADSTKEINNIELRLARKRNNTSTATWDISNIQLEINNIATDFVEYTAPVEFTQNDDIKSIYPTTTLTTDTTGALIECEYNRDINKAFIELQQAIISLGGNV